MKSVVQTRLLEQIEQAIAYLTEQAQINPAYNRLIDRLNSTAEKCRTTAKPRIKLLSPSASLAEKLKAKSQQDASWRSLFELQVISPIVNVGQIVRDCDVICSIYFYKHRILEHHRHLIDLATREDIPLVLLVNQPKRKTEYTNVSSWLTAQDYSIADSQLPIDHFDRFIDLNNSQHLACYRQHLVKLLPSARTRQSSKIKLEVIQIVRSFFQQEISHLRRQSDRPQPTVAYPHGQHLGQTQSRLNREVQQTTAKIKQDLNHSKSDLLNPFNPDSLSFMIQQSIYFSHPTLVREKDRTYVYLKRDRSSDGEYLHNYVWQLCEQKIDEIMASQWWRITRLNVEYSTLSVTNIKAESYFHDSSLSFVLAPQPKLDLKQLINRNCLKFNSRIVFDYHFTQSSWFRLLVLSLVGLAIYLVTWIYFGSGRTIGFVIVIFQLINLFIGHDLKTVKLKQHSKELKRIVDTKYQSLVRQIVDKATQVLISAVDRESQLARQNIERAIAVARDSSDRSSPTFNHPEVKIKTFQQEQTKILSWFD